MNETKKKNGLSQYWLVIIILFFIVFPLILYSGEEELDEFDLCSKSSDAIKSRISEYAVLDLLRGRWDYRYANIDTYYVTTSSCDVNEIDDIRVEIGISVLTTDGRSVYLMGHADVDCEYDSCYVERYEAY